MKYKTLGSSDINISQICLGTMTWGEQNSQQDAHEQIELALDSGVNFMDTAELYAVPPKQHTQGLTEEYIGSWFKNTGKRDKWVLATKITGAGISYIRGGTPITPKNIKLALEGSLQRLQTDYIDLYQLHWPNRGSYHFQNSWNYDPSKQDKNQTIEQMHANLETLSELIKEGKIRTIGLSNETCWGTAKYLELAKKHDLPLMVSIQNEYSLLQRTYDLDLAELSHHENIGLLAWSPLASGILSGKYLDGACPKGSRGDISGDFWRLNKYSEPAVRAYVNLAKDNDIDPCQMAIAYCLAKPFMNSVIIGATTLEQLNSNIKSIDIKLDENIISAIEAIHRLYPRPL